MKTVLAIDTSGAACSVALWEARLDPGASPTATSEAESHGTGTDGLGGIVLGSIRHPMARGHAESLLPLIDTLLQRTDRRTDDIDLIGVIHGPGAFTGLRIGLAAAAGLSLATGAPVVGVNAFDAFAEGTLSALDMTPTPSDRDTAMACTVAVAIDSRRRELYLRTYRAERGQNGWSLGPGSAMAAIPVTDARLPKSAPVRVTGSGARRFCDEHPALSPDNRRPPETIDAGVVARLAWRARSDASPDLPDPLYLRPPDAVAATPPRGIIDRAGEGHATAPREPRHDPPAG